MRPRFELEEQLVVAVGSPVGIAGTSVVVAVLGVVAVSAAVVVQGVGRTEIIFKV